MDSFTQIGDKVFSDLLEKAVSNVWDKVGGTLMGEPERVLTGIFYASELFYRTMHDLKARENVITFFLVGTCLTAILRQWFCGDDARLSSEHTRVIYDELEPGLERDFKKAHHTSKQECDFKQLYQIQSPLNSESAQNFAAKLFEKIRPSRTYKLLMLRNFHVFGKVWLQFLELDPTMFDIFVKHFVSDAEKVKDEFVATEDVFYKLMESETIDLDGYHCFQPEL